MRFPARFQRELALMDKKKWKKTYFCLFSNPVYALPSLVLLNLFLSTPDIHLWPFPWAPRSRSWSWEIWAGVLSPEDASSSSCRTSLDLSKLQLPICNEVPTWQWRFNEIMQRRGQNTQHNNKRALEQDRQVRFLVPPVFHQPESSGESCNIWAVLSRSGLRGVDTLPGQGRVHSGHPPLSSSSSNFLYKKLCCQQYFVGTSEQITQVNPFKN